MFGLQASQRVLAGAETGCSSAGNTLLVFRSWFVNQAFIDWQRSQPSQESYWVGKYEEVQQFPVTTESMWVTGGQEVQEDCVMADKTQGFKWTRVSCSASASYLCEPSPPDCPPGYSFIASVGDSSCFKLSDMTHEMTTGSNHIASITTANKMCLEDGNRLISPLTDSDRRALVQFAYGMDQLQMGEGSRTVKVWTGLMYFKQSDTIPATCSTCSSLPAWQDGFLSPWSDSLLAKTDGETLFGSHFSETDKCHNIKYDGNLTYWANSQCVQSPSAADQDRVFAMCEYRKCSGCVFPFTLAGRKYDTCTRVGTQDGAAWCSTQTDSSGRHVEGQTQPCPTGCPVNDCPVGFRKHLKTCLQESASSRHDDPLNISLAEEECLFQGGRLYQPRSTRTLNAASVLIPRVYDGSQTSEAAWGIHGWAPQAGLQQETAIGMTYNLSEETPSLYYKDGSKVPSGLIAAKLNWNTNFPLTNDTNKTCITLQEIDKLSNNDCQFTDKESRALSYVCEARPFTTVEGPLDNPGKACVFPFKKTAGGWWQHSCVYDPLPDSQWSVWCPTKVDADGVMVEGEVGDCDDERNTAYDGPDADNTCKLPFFYDGRWYENCTLYPRDDYWCATKVDPVSREMIDRELTDRHFSFRI